VVHGDGAGVAVGDSGLQAVGAIKHRERGETAPRET
jgi:hypothetical protein